MKKSIILTISLLMAGAFAASAQDCTLFFPQKEGTKLTYTNYSKPGKVDSYLTYLIKNKNSDQSRITIEAENLNAKGKSELKYEFDAWCEDGSFYIDMRNMISSMQVKDIEGFKIETNDLHFPSTMKEGQQLKDASMKMSMQGPISMAMSVSITNRNVEAVEDISTPAGTFKCCKISSVVKSDMGFIKVENQVTEWYSENIGMVKSVTQNKGKVISTCELTQIE